jgi:hypothetical protein
VIGLVLGALGGAALAWLAFVKLVLGEPIGGRPLLMIGVLSTISGIQMLTTGVLAEMILRVSNAASHKSSYAIRNSGESQRAAREGWMVAPRRD